MNIAQRQAKVYLPIGRSWTTPAVLLPSFISICVSFSSVESVEELNLDYVSSGRSQRLNNTDVWKEAGDKTAY